MQEYQKATIKQITVETLPAPSQKGDAAIAVGAIKLLREAFPSARTVGVAGRLDTANPWAVRSFIETYNVDHVIRHPVSYLSSSSLQEPSRVARHVARIAEATRQALFLGTRSVGLSLARLLGKGAGKLLPGHLRELVQTIAASDLVIMRGGGYLSSPHLLCDIIGLKLNALYVISIARALGVPYAIWGHTFFQLNGPLSKRFLWPIIADSAVTVCREQISQRYLLNNKAPADKIVTLPDTAFALEPPSAARVQEILEQEQLEGVGPPLLGVNVRPPWDVESGPADLEDRYLDAVAQMIEHMQVKHGAHIVLISHCHSSEAFRLPIYQDEKRLQRDLMQKLNATDHVHILQGEYDPTDLVGLYSALEATVATRLHVGILSACAGTPSVSIAYEKTKAYGIARMMGLQEFVVDIESITAEQLTEQVEKVWNLRSQLRSRLEEEVLPRLRSQLSEYVSLTLRGMEQTS